MGKLSGRIQLGEHLSPATEFKPGQHWRPRKPHWDRAWLDREYTEKKRSSADIAAESGCGATAILFWLGRHNIPRRSTSETRAAKRWGLVGAANPMFGRVGPDNPRYIDGSSPERQRLYSRSAGKAFLSAVYERDGYRCVHCGAPNTGPRSLHAHHLRSWAGHSELRFDLDNAVTLCADCHAWVHSRANTERAYLR